MADLISDVVWKLLEASYEIKECKKITKGLRRIDVHAETTWLFNYIMAENHLNSAEAMIDRLQRAGIIKIG